MIRKLTTALPLAIVLSAALTAPALARTHEHRPVQALREYIVSPSAHGSDMYRGDATQRRQATLQWINNPASPGG
jgi:hypothetical protein